MDGPIVKLEEGKRVIQWASAERSPFLISAELFEQLIDDLNERDSLLNEFADDDPCMFDHHGNCETHNFSLDPGEACPNHRALALLLKVSNADR